MPGYVVLYNWTDQGVKNLTETVTRARQATAAAEKAGGKITSLFWTLGRYDLIGFGEWPDEASAIAFNMSLGKLGNVRTETLRAFTMEEMEKIVKKVS